MKFSLCLKAPLFTDWPAQYIRFHLPGIEPGAPLRLEVNGQPHDFQFTGRANVRGAEVLLKIGLAKEERKELVFFEAERSATCLEEIPQLLDAETQIGSGAARLTVGKAFPFFGFAGQRMEGEIRCSQPLTKASLARGGEGPLFSDYQLTYQMKPGAAYRLDFRCYKKDPWIEVTETFSLGMDAAIHWRLNPDRRWTHIISRDDFHSETGPTVEPLDEARPGDLLCRLQMPVLTEYFIPNNRGWFAFFDPRDPERGMQGILGLRGGEWEEPAASMPELFTAGGAVEWRASLVSGRRRWLWVQAPVETAATPEHRHLFHRLHAEFNALRLDEHLDLAEGGIWDAKSWNTPGFFSGSDPRQHWAERLSAIPALQKYHAAISPKELADQSIHETLFIALAKPGGEIRGELRKKLFERFELWVRQFQGWRQGKFDYAKAVIGFSRLLRGMLMAYELLRKDGFLSEADVHRFGAYGAFAARRIMDEGRWPHDRTWKHPDHPESVRDFYTYGGEHKPDRLVWTNSLPNFQSDPLCALIHLACVFPEHPDAATWLRLGREDLDRQLDAYCGDSGAWVESINYALYTLSYFAITFQALKNRYGIDYFNDPRVRRMVSWLCRFFGPYDKRFGSATWPAIGNAVVPQNQVHYLLACASGLAKDDPLRREILAIYKRVENDLFLGEHYGTVLAALAPEIPAEAPPLTPLGSEIMDEVGVSMRDRHPGPEESYLFQKIGFAKDHYEQDETAFNWYAKGDPFCMDYGTYTSDIAVGSAHNLVEIPDMDFLRRGYLADHLFTAPLDYTRCEVPVTRKLLWGRTRSFAEIDGADGVISREKTPYYYIGDKNPVGPKAWKVRQMLFVKPDYLVVFDRVFGAAEHRWNLHFTGGEIRREGSQLNAEGRFGLDLLVHISHPAEFRLETGEIIPRLKDERQRRKHAQHFCRVYNERDGIYRALIFAREKGREVVITAAGSTGFKVETAEFTDYAFVSDEFVKESAAEFEFSGRAGWIRRYRDGSVEAVMADGECLGAFGWRIEGSGPWRLAPGEKNATLYGNPPGRLVTVRATP